MKTVVHKYGGSSLGTFEKRMKVAERIVASHRDGNSVVVVVSAMGDTTDDLLEMAHRITPSPSRRELDMLLSVGERISMALLSIALQSMGVEAVSFTGSQAGIMTTDAHARARIVEVRPFRVEDELRRGKVVIVAGFQGTSYRREVTTLGRGGSDTTAIALAAALSAYSCDIFTDVDGVYSGDPRHILTAKRLDELDYEEMQELARLGASVLNAEAVEFARRRGIALYVRASAGDSDAKTLVRRIDGADTKELARLSRWNAAGVVQRDAVVLLTHSQGSADSADFLSALDGAPLLALHADPSAGKLEALVCVEERSDVDGWLAGLRGKFDGLSVEADLAIAAVVGSGIGDHPAAAAHAFKLLSELGVKPRAFMTTRDSLVTVVEAGRERELGAKLHERFIEDTAP